jgi:GNAT superfamily N-acetyltransferase
MGLCQLRLALSMTGKGTMAQAAATVGPIRRLTDNAPEFASLTFPRLARMLTPLSDGWFAVGVCDDFGPIGLVLGRRGGGEVAHLLSVTVDRRYRRTGLGSSLLAAWQNEAMTYGATALVVAYSSRLAARLPLESILRALSWGPPRLTMLYMAGETGTMVDAVATWPAMSRLMRQPNIEFASWRDPDEADRAAIARLSAQDLFRSGMAPEPDWMTGLDQDVSVGVRRSGDLIGWVAARPVARPIPGVPAGRHALYYTSAYIDEPVATTGLLVGAYFTAYERQAARYGRSSVAALHTNMPRMQAMVSRRFAPIAFRVDEVFESRLALVNGGAAGRVTQRPITGFGLGR